MLQPAVASDGLPRYCMHTPQCWPDLNVGFAFAATFDASGTKPSDCAVGSVGSSGVRSVALASTALSAGITTADASAHFRKSRRTMVRDMGCSSQGLMNAVT